MKGITPTSDGYLIRIYRAGRTISGHVAYGQYRNEELALRAAVRLLEDLEKRYPKKSRPKRKPSVGYTYARGNSGKGMRMFCWQVVYYVDDQKKTKRFYVHKYADPNQAKEDAYAFAKEHE